MRNLDQNQVFLCSKLYIITRHLVYFLSAFSGLLALFVIYCPPFLGR